MKRIAWMKWIALYLLFSLRALDPAAGQSAFYDQLADSAFTLTYQRVRYDPGYYSLRYPGGDVPEDRGVCTDVIIRAYRKMGIDLQKEVHEDMTGNFNMYPNYWGMQHTDKNIDHRRVPNLMTFFKRHGIEKEISALPSDYEPGDIVCWDLGNGIRHVGIVVKQRSPDGERNLIVHNIGGGQVAEDCLFRFRIIGHYRYKK
jgi:uncharacterized protein YijF (DUF1287 family)